MLLTPDPCQRNERFCNYRTLHEKWKFRVVLTFGSFVNIGVSSSVLFCAQGIDTSIERDGNEIVFVSQVPENRDMFMFDSCQILLNISNDRDISIEDRVHRYLFSLRRSCVHV